MPGSSSTAIRDCTPQLSSSPAIWSLPGWRWSPEYSRSRVSYTEPSQVEKVYVMVSGTVSR